MSIWRQPATPEQINSRFNENNVNGLLGIRVTEVGEDDLRGEMPVDHRHVQPFGIIHGGVSVVLAETLGSLASMMCCEPGFGAVGLEVSATHLRPVSKGETVRAHCRAIRVGRTVHVWDIRLSRPDGELSCIARLTVAIVERK